jgi:hypothetical protein
MTSRILAAPALGAVAVAAMLATTATSTEAFTLSAPSVEKSVAGADIDHVYYYRGGGYHYGYHAGYYHGGYGYGYGYHGGYGRRCWWGAYGNWVCA